VHLSARAGRFLRVDRRRLKSEGARGNIIDQYLDAESPLLRAVLRMAARKGEQ
jgi:hypothetical protein